MLNLVNLDNFFSMYFLCEILNFIPKQSIIWISMSIIFFVL